MSYTIRVPEIEGPATLRWLSKHGYDAGLWDSCFEQVPAGDGYLVYEISEPDAWEVYFQVYDENGEWNEDAFSCLDWDSETGRAIQKFLEEIV